MHIEMLVSWLQDAHHIKAAKDAMVSIGCEVSAMPKTLDDLIMAKFSRLSEEAKRVVLLAASAGELFDPKYVMDASKSMSVAESRPNEVLKENSVLSGLSDGEDEGLLEGIKDATSDNESLRVWKFKHDTIHRCIWLKTPGPKRETFDRTVNADRKALAVRLKSL